MRKLFYIPFYYMDWLGSDARARLSRSQRWAFLELVMLAHLENGLPNDPTFLARKLGIESAADPDLKAALQEFEKQPDGRLHHPRAMAVLEDREKKSNAENARWRPKQDDDDMGF
ncbi:MAG TPA: DUF1376 domain-containing protein [Bryobacteraceae bacterium]